MLEDFLHDIYYDALTYELVKEASFYSSIRHVFNRMDFWNDASERLEKMIYSLKDIDINASVALMQASLNAKKNFSDWHTFSAVIDTEVVPKIAEYLKRFTGINVTEGDWTLESSQTGFLTLKDSDGRYLHSPSDPMWESFLYAYSIFDPDAKRYYILGGGLGYLAYQLWRLSEGEAEIYVFEVDKKLSEYADLYGVISYIDPEKIHYVTGDDVDEILGKYADDDPNFKTVRTIYYWNIEKYKGTFADIFKILYSTEVTGVVFEKKWRSNYDWNISYEHKFFSELDKDSFNDEWVVVGAGPSLNYNEEFIRESIGKRTICAVNSSFKWFYLHDIKPNLCTVCDPTDLLVPHIEGYEDFSKDVPIVADIVGNRRFLELYRGDKYYIFSQAAALAAGKDKVVGDIWSFGGTVTSMALEVAIRLGAKKVYLIGADLSYPDGAMHADGVGHDVKKWNRSEETVVSVDDKIIPTSVIFREYKYMMEQQIAEHPEVEIINMSKHGAYLKGTFCNRWWEDLSHIDYAEGIRELQKESYLLGWQEKYFIFWQMIARMDSEDVKNAVDKDLSATYKAIYESFKKEIAWEISSEVKCNAGQTYIFSDSYDGKNIQSKRILKLAESELKKNRAVLIVNTAERMGGKWIAIHDKIICGYAEELMNSDKVYISNMSVPYFQFPKGMPDIQYYKVFLDSIAKSKPGRIINTSKYSLLADYCGEILDIPMERKI